MSKAFLKDTLIAILFVITGGFICAINLFDFGWDFVNYHYYNPFAFLNDRMNYDILPAAVNTFFNPLIDIPYYFMLQYLKQSPIILFGIQGIWYGLLLFVFYKFSGLLFDTKTLKGKLLTILSVLIAATGQAVWFQAGSTTNEIQVGFCVFTALYFIFKMVKYPEQQKGYTYLLTGLLLGLILGLKPTCIYICVGTGMALIGCFQYLKHPFRFITLFAIGGLVGFLITNGWWMYRMWNLYDNPFFPFLNGIFQSSYIVPINYSDPNYIPPLHIKPIYPYVWLESPYNALETDFFDPRGCIFYTAALLFLLWGIIKPKRIIDLYKNNHLLFFFILSILFYYILWINIFGIYRYLLVVEMLSAIYFVKLAFYYQPKTDIKLISYYTFVSLLCCICIANAWIGISPGVVKKERNEMATMEKIHLPENTLLKLFDIPTAGVIPILAQDFTFRAVGYPEHNQNNNGSDLFTPTTFTQMRNQIENTHTGPVVIIFNKGPFYKTADEWIETICLDKNDYCQKIKLRAFEELQDKYCRPLENTLKESLYICVPYKQKDEILITKEKTHER